MPTVNEDEGNYDREKVTLEVGDKIKTALSDETIVLDIDKDNAILFDGRQFVEVYGLQSDNGKFFWNHGNYSDSYPQKKDSQIIDTINKMIDEDYEGFVKALITIETGIDNSDLLDELYDRFMHNDGVNLINDYFDEVIYDLEDEITIGEEKVMETEGKPNKDNEIFEKMDDFINSYTELSNTMYGVDYDFADSYPLEKSFHDIDFIDWVEATKANLSKEKKRMNIERINDTLDKKDNKKESTIAKLNKLKDKVANDSIGRAQEKVDNKKDDREI